LSHSLSQRSGAAIVAGLAALAVAAACTGDDVSPAGPPDGSSADTSMVEPDSFSVDAGALLRVTRTDLVVDQGDAGVLVDPQLIDPWGFAFTPAGIAWIGDNGPGLITQYSAAGVPSGPPISIPGAGGVGQGAPSGEVFNATPADFEGDQFVLSTEDGTIAGWQSGSAAVLRVDESTANAVFKGLDVIDSPTGRVLCVANFHAGTVELFDTTYSPVALPAGAFVDPGVTPGFAPHNVLISGASVFIAYAKQDSMKHDDQAGPGNGLIDVFDETGVFLRRLVTGGPLNSPWGLALAPADYSSLAGALVVGNFGDGTVVAFDPATGAFRGRFADNAGGPFSIEGLWALRFGQDQPSESHTQLFFTAGPGGESHGVFGRIDLSL
jgi:uncharacterized protein (TIGR03118 family)